RLPEVKPAGQGQEPGRLVAIVQQGTDHDPVVGAHDRGAVGAAGGVLVEGAGTPDVGTAAVRLGIVDGVDVIAPPESAWSGLDQARQFSFDPGVVPGSGFGEGLEGFPVLGAVETDERLGDSVFFDVEGQAGDPLAEAMPAGVGESPAERAQKFLPQRPYVVSLHTTPPVSVRQLYVSC